MEFFYENPLPLLALGSVLITFFGLVFLTRRDLKSLLLVAAAVLLTVLLVAVEKFVVTEKEEIESSITGLMEAVEESDLAEVLTFVDPAATHIKTDVEQLLPLIDMNDTSASVNEIAINDAASPMTAAGEVHAKVDGIHTKSGIRLFYFDRVLLNWVKKNDRWLLTDYTPFYRGKPISAVESVRSNRPIY